MAMSIRDLIRDMEAMEPVDGVRIIMLRIITGKGDIIMVVGAVVEIGAYDFTFVCSYSTPSVTLLTFCLQLLRFFK